MASERTPDSHGAQEQALAKIAELAPGHCITVEIYPGRGRRFVAKAMAPAATPYLLITADLNELQAALAIPAHQRWTTTLDGQRLRQLRHQRGLTQADLALQAGISLTAVARLERRPHASCRPRTLTGLAAALGEPRSSLTATQ